MDLQEEGLRHMTLENAILIREEAGKKIYYTGNRRFRVDGLDVDFPTEYDAIDAIYLLKDWNEAKDISAIRVEFPYVQKWTMRLLLKREKPYYRPEGWYCLDIGDPLPRVVYRGYAYIRYSDELWKKANEMLRKWNEVMDWQRNVEMMYGGVRDE